jgi:hypothetical protein
VGGGGERKVERKRERKRESVCCGEKGDARFLWVCVWRREERGVGRMPGIRRHMPGIRRRMPGIRRR